MTENQPVCPADHRWHFAGLEWEYDSHRRRFHRWGVGDGSFGVCNYSNPLSAYLGFRAWRRGPHAPAGD